MKTLLILFSFFAVTACSTYKNIGLTVEHAAAIDLHPQVRTAMMVNRTIPENIQTTVGNVLEGIFSGESIMADRLGAKSALNGIVFALSQTNRLRTVGGIVDMKTNTVISAPLAFSWEVIDSLCSANGADMVVACEFFDSDQVGTVGGLPVPNTPNTGNSTVRAYFRVYDNINKQIIDEQMMFYHVGGGGGALVLQGANNVERRAYGTGYQYGRMLVPYTNFERRELFFSGSRQMRMATKTARAGNWTTATNLWNELQNSGKRRLTYRAIYNLAVAAEVAGNLDLARSHAERAFGIKPKTHIARYMQIINFRIEEQDRLARQKQTE